MVTNREKVTKWGRGCGAGQTTSGRGAGLLSLVRPRKTAVAASWIGRCRHCRLQGHADAVTSRGAQEQFQEAALLGGEDAEGDGRLDDREPVGGRGSGCARDRKCRRMPGRTFAARRGRGRDRRRGATAAGRRTRRPRRTGSSGGCAPVRRARRAPPPVRRTRRAPPGPARTPARPGRSPARPWPRRRRVAGQTPREGVGHGVAQRFPSTRRPGKDGRPLLRAFCSGRWRIPGDVVAPRTAPATFSCQSVKSSSRHAAEAARRCTGDGRTSTGCGSTWGSSSAQRPENRVPKLACPGLRPCPRAGDQGVRSQLPPRGGRHHKPGAPGRVPVRSARGTTRESISHRTCRRA